MSKRICSQCGEEKDIEEFPLRKQFTQRRQSYCKDCKSIMHGDWYERNKEYQKENASKHRVEYRETLREYVYQYLLSHPCEGYLPDGTKCPETDPAILQFHHVRGIKTADVSVLIGRGSSLEKLKQEIDKCQVLCSNCHARLTAKERGFFRSRK